GRSAPRRGPDDPTNRDGAGPAATAPPSAWRIPRPSPRHRYPRATAPKHQRLAATCPRWKYASCRGNPQVAEELRQVGTAGRRHRARPEAAGNGSVVAEQRGDQEG